MYSSIQPNPEFKLFITEEGKASLRTWKANLGAIMGLEYARAAAQESAIKYEKILKGNSMKLFLYGMCPEDRKWHTLYVGDIQDCGKLKFMYELPASPLYMQFMCIAEKLTEAKKMWKERDKGKE